MWGRTHLRTDPADVPQIVAMQSITGDVIPFVEIKVDAGSIRGEIQIWRSRSRFVDEEGTTTQRIACKVDKIGRRLVVDKGVRSFDISDGGEEVGGTFSLDLLK